MIVYQLSIFKPDGSRAVSIDISEKLAAMLRSYLATEDDPDCFGGEYEVPDVFFGAVEDSNYL
jgi:hypothetical protein